MILLIYLLSISFLHSQNLIMIINTCMFIIRILFIIYRFHCLSLTLWITTKKTIPIYYYIQPLFSVSTFYFQLSLIISNSINFNNVKCLNYTWNCHKITIWLVWQMQFDFIFFLIRMLSALMQNYSFIA